MTRRQLTCSGSWEEIVGREMKPRGLANEMCDMAKVRDHELL